MVSQGSESRLGVGEDHYSLVASFEGHSEFHGCCLSEVGFFLEHEDHVRFSHESAGEELWLDDKDWPVPEGSHEDLFFRGQALVVAEDVAERHQALFQLFRHAPGGLDDDGHANVPQEFPVAGREDLVR